MNTRNEKLPLWMWAFIISNALIIILISFLLILPKEAKEVKEFPTSRVLGTKTITFCLQPGEEISYKVPPKHWFRIYSKHNILVKKWDNRIIKGTIWLGDEIRDANFKIKSKEKKRNAIVRITLRPKK